MKLPLIAIALPLAALWRVWVKTRRHTATGPIRILQIADHLGYDAGIRHGVTTYFLAVLSGLRVRDRIVEACFLRERHPAADELERRGIRTHFLGRQRADIRTAWHLLRLLHTFKPDIVLATQMESTLLTRALRLVSPRCLLVVHVHDTDRLPALLRTVSHLLPSPDLTFCVSEPARLTAIDQYGIARSRTRVLHNGLDLEHFLSTGQSATEDLRRSLGIPPDAHVIGRFARMHPDKCNDRLVRILPRILQQVPDAVVVFAGEGPDRGRCEALARELGVTHAVRFLGQRDDIAALNQACDVMAITTPEEPFGFVVIEAYAVGRPVVGFAAGGLPELIEHERTGLLAEPENLLQFCDHLVRLLLDDDLRTRLGDNARIASRRFSLERHLMTFDRELGALLSR